MDQAMCACNQKPSSCQLVIHKQTKSGKHRAPNSTCSWILVMDFFSFLQAIFFFFLKSIAQVPALDRPWSCARGQSASAACSHPCAVKPCAQGRPRSRQSTNNILIVPRHLASPGAAVTVLLLMTAKPARSALSANLLRQPC